jgi:DNA invertase Pin-like site-specific DNA recombinase
MPQAISYIRFSSGKQAKGSSLERQQSMIARWLESHPEYTLSTLSYKDLGKSGYSGEHLEGGELGQLLQAVEQGLIKGGDCILVEAVDRIGRLPSMRMLSIFSDIVLAGVQITTLDDGQTYTNESLNNSLLFLLVAKIQQAHQYSEALSRRIKASYEKRKKDAKEGQKVRRHVPIWLTSEGEIKPDIAPYIVQAFEDYAAGLGERRIVRRIREGGHPDLQSLNGTTVKRWLRNRTAIGYWDEIPDVYPAIIGRELWYRVQEQLKGKTRNGSAPSKYLLSGLVKCGHCGRNFNVHKKQATSGPVMQCTSRARLSLDGCSNSRSIPKQVLEFIRVETSLPFVQKALNNQQLNIHQKRIVEIDGELEDLNKKTEGLGRAIQDIGYNDILAAQLKELSAKAQALREERIVLEREPFPDTEDSLSLRLADLELVQNDALKLNALLQGVGYTITCYQDGLIVVADDPYPWLYLGVDRKTREYMVSHLGEVHRLKMLSPVQLEAIEAAGIELRHKAPDGSGNELLDLITADHRRHSTIYLP